MSDTIAKSHKAVIQMYIFNNRIVAEKVELPSGAVPEVPYADSIEIGRQGVDRLTRYAQDRYIRFFAAAEFFERIRIQHDRITNLHAHHFLRAIEYPDNLKSEILERKMVEQCFSDIAGTDQNRTVIVGKAENFRDRVFELGNGIPVTLLAEIAEAAQVLTDLRRIDEHILSEIL